MLESLKSAGLGERREDGLLVSGRMGKQAALLTGHPALTGIHGAVKLLGVGGLKSKAHAATLIPACSPRSSAVFLPLRLHSRRSNSHSSHGAATMTSKYQNEHTYIYLTDLPLFIISPPGSKTLFSMASPYACIPKSAHGDNGLAVYND